MPSYLALPHEIIDFMNSAAAQELAPGPSYRGVTMRILHIVETLSRDGRTILLHELVRHANSSHQHLVVTLKDTGRLTDRFREIGIEVQPMSLYKPFRGLRQKWNSWANIMRFKPDVCLCWSGDSNIISILPRLFGIPVIWTLHNSNIRWASASTRYGVRFAAFLSTFVPNAIICCSNRTYEVYRDTHHFRSDKLLVIANGVDVSRFRPNKLVRTRVRSELGIPDSTLVVSSATRIKLPGRTNHGDVKDLEALLETAAIACRQKQDMLFLLFGTNLDKDNVQLAGWIKKYGLLPNVMLLGFQADVAALFAASDIYAMSSTSEGLPMSLIEAMACGAIPVCTDAGDIRIVVGSSGLVVPQKDTAKLAAAMLQIAGLSEEQRFERSNSAVEIVGKFYNIESVAKRYIDVLLQASSGSTK